MPSKPQSQALDDSPVKLNDSLTTQRSEYDDCLPCRLMGSAAFTGLGIYSYYSGRKQLKERSAEIERQVANGVTRIGLRERRAGVLVTSAALVAIGAYRLVN